MILNSSCSTYILFFERPSDSVIVTGKIRSSPCPPFFLFTLEFFSFTVLSISLYLAYFMFSEFETHVFHKFWAVLGYSKSHSQLQFSIFFFFFLLHIFNSVFLCCILDDFFRSILQSLVVV